MKSSPIQFVTRSFAILCACLAVATPTFAEQSTCKEFTSSGTVRMGMKNNSLVAELQKELNAIQGEKLKTDGNFGSGTRAAVQRLQKQLNQKTDGVAGPATFAAIRAYYEAQCATSGDGAVAKRVYTNELKKFSGSSDFQKFIQSQPQNNANRYPMMPVAMGTAVTTMAMADGAISTTANSSGSAAAAPNYSQTNTQEAAVDESDIIKTDGTYIYTLSGGLLTITKTDAHGKLNVVSSTDVFADQNTMSANDMYLNGKTVVIIGSQTIYNVMTTQVSGGNTVTNTDLMRFAPQYAVEKTSVQFYNVSDAAHPQLIKEYSFSGSSVQSRIVAGELYLITKSSPRYTPAGIMDTPEMTVNGTTTSVPAASIYYFDMPYQSFEFTQVHAISVNKPTTVATSTYLLSGGNTLYASENALYLSYTDYHYDRMTIMPVTTAVTNQATTTDVAVALMPEYREPVEETVIHKFSLNKNGATLTATGTVPGRAINQFAFSEYAGNVRVATTAGNNWNGSQSANAMYVLDSNLDRMGTLENLAPGERIYSVRFVDDKAYLVTFEQVDPLFVISLKNPRKPFVLGELKIPGFSTYLHPYDATTILGIGRDTEVIDGRVHQKGVKVALFDVSNVNRPRVIDSMVLGGVSAFSTALDDHKAVLFSKEKNLLVMQFSDFESYGTEPGDRFNGAVVLSVSKSKGIKQQGKIAHVVEGSYGNMISRTLYIGNNLYSMSYNYLQSNNLGNLKTVDLVKISGAGSQ